MKPIILSFFVIIFFTALFLDNKDNKPVVMERKVTSSAEFKNITKSDSILTKFVIQNNDLK